MPSRLQIIVLCLIIWLNIFDALASAASGILCDDKCKPLLIDTKIETSLGLITNVSPLMTDITVDNCSTVKVSCPSKTYFIGRFGYGNPTIYNTSSPTLRCHLSDSLYVYCLPMTIDHSTSLSTPTDDSCLNIDVLNCLSLFA